MGSKCSILNDTQHDVWITHGINWPSFVAVVTFLLSLARICTGAVNIYAGKALVVFDGFIGKLLLCGTNEAQKKRTDRASAKLIKPGEKYTWSGTLSLHMRVYVMNDNLQYDDRACFTGPTAGSEYIYPISEYFKKLDVKTD
jgi:hypothetical protein